MPAAHMCGSSSTSPNSRTCSLEKESSTSFCGRTPRSSACATVAGSSQIFGPDVRVQSVIQSGTAVVRVYPPWPARCSGPQAPQRQFPADPAERRASMNLLWQHQLLACTSAARHKTYQWPCPRPLYKLGGLNTLPVRQTAWFATAFE
jgi:hypothetical protein